MKTIRRLYFYAVTFVAVEVILWGLIALLRQTLAAGLLPNAALLSRGLALIIVGLPFFLIHWLAAQGFARREEEERASTLRAVFLYGILLATGIPAVQNVLALVNRLLLAAFRAEAFLAIVGGYQNWADNLIALVMNLGAGYYFLRVLTADRAALADREAFDSVARLARFAWVLYGLGLLVFGVQQLLTYALSPASIGLVGFAARRPFFNGLALTLVGAPLWISFWLAAQRRLADESEARSTLRLGVLYLLALGGALVTLLSAGEVLQRLLELALGARSSATALLSDLRAPLALGLPFAVLWAYHGARLGESFRSYPDPARRPALRRLYLYILSLLGLAALTFGTAAVFNTLLDMLFVSYSLADRVAQRAALAGGLAATLIGLPLWLSAWRSVQVEALDPSARRSLVRRAYLYFVLFAAVIGVMASAVALVYQLIVGLLDPAAFNEVVVRDVAPLLVIFSLLLGYHLTCLRRDAAHLAALPAVESPEFSALVLDPGDPAWVASLTAALRQAAPEVRVIVRPASGAGAADARAVLLPAALALDPPEALRSWLRDFPGARVVVPGPVVGWEWPGVDPRRGFAAAAVRVRDLARGESSRPAAGPAAWQIVAYVFAALFAVELLFLLLALFLSTLRL